jgi:hypothetical protein
LTAQNVDLIYTTEFRGQFTLEVDEAGWTGLLYESPPEHYEAAGENPDNPAKIPLLRISPDGETDQVVISPVSTLPNNRFLKRKYRKSKR